MHGNQVVQEQTESDLYQHLSDFIKIFKRLMHLADSAVSMLLRQEDCLPQLAQLRQTTSEQHLLEMYNFSLPDHSPHRNTYFRFVCRLIENAAPFRSRLVHAHPAVAILGELLDRVDLTLNSYKCDRNIGKVFKQIFAHANKFCLSCELILINTTPEAAAEILARKEEPAKESETNSPAVGGKLHFANSQSNFHKVMSGVNRRFATLSCLDVDYNSFKTAFFLSRNQKNELFTDIFERNHFVLRQIANYSKLFQEYLKRREKGIARRNRFRETKTLPSTSKPNDKRTIDATDNEEKHVYSYSKQRELPALKDSTFRTDQLDEQMQKLQDIDFKDIDIQRRKTSYQLKNVFLTLTKINTEQIVPIQYISANPTVNSQKLKPQPPKLNKPSLKTSKFIETQPSAARPILQIRQCEFKNTNLNLQQSVMIRQMGYGELSSEVKGSLLSKFHFSKKSISQKKNIRITQMVSKSMKNSKMVNKSSVATVQEDCEFRIVNAEEDTLQ